MEDVNFNFYKMFEKKYMCMWVPMYDFDSDEFPYALKVRACFIYTLFMLEGCMLILVYLLLQDIQRKQQIKVVIGINPKIHKM